MLLFRGLSYSFYFCTSFLVWMYQSLFNHFLIGGHSGQFYLSSFFPLSLVEGYLSDCIYNHVCFSVLAALFLILSPLEFKIEGQGTCKTILLQAEVVTRGQAGATVASWPFPQPASP